MRKFGVFFQFFFLNLERLHLGWRDGVCFVLFFKQNSAVFIEICIILPGNAAPF